MTHQMINSFDLDTVIKWIQSQDFKVTRPLILRESYSDMPPPSNLLKVAILDTETTGLNLEVDKVIELGIVIVEYCPETALCIVTGKQVRLS